jgi:hypothetical protein
MPLNLTVMQRHAYGQTLLYPESPHAKALAELMQVKTLTPGQLAHARKHLGANVVIKVPSAPDLDSLLGSKT